MNAVPIETILDVTNLFVRIGETPVLHDLSFSVPQGTSLAVIGPNGSGKTVLFRALIGAIPFEGIIRWAPGVRIGYVPQKLDIARDVPITGLDFLGARAALGGSSHPPIADVLNLVGLSSAASDQSIGAMSGGQFQRLLVAFALVGNPNGPDVSRLIECGAGAHGTWIHECAALRRRKAGLAGGRLARRVKPRDWWTVNLVELTRVHQCGRVYQIAVRGAGCRRKFRVAR